MDNLPEELKTEDAGAADHDPRRRRQPAGHALRREPDQRPAHGTSRGSWSRRWSRSRTTASTSTAPLDLKGTLRAMITNQANSGVVQGGSSITQQLVKLTLISQAKTKRRRSRRRHRRHLRPQDQASCATRSRWRRATPRTGSSSATSTRRTSATVPTASRRPPSHYFDVNARELNVRQAALLAGLVKNPYRLRPDQLPRPGHRAAQRRAGPDGRAQRDHPGEGREDQGARPRARRPGRRQRLRDTRPRRSSATTSSTGCCKDPRLGENPEERMNAAQDRRPDDQDHDRHRHAGGRRQRRRGARLLQRTRRSAPWRWSSPAPATCKAIAQSRPMGAARRPGETYLNYVVPEEFGDSQVLPGRVDVQGVHARGRARAGHPAEQGVRRAGASMTFDTSDFANCPGRADLRLRRLPGRRTRPSSGRMNLYSGTRLSVNTFYMQLEQRDRGLRALRAGQGDGRRASPTPWRPQGNGAELIPYFTLGVASASARWRWPRPTPPSPPAACTATSRPVTEILDSGGNRSADYAAQCAQVMQQTDRRRGQRRARAACIEGGFASAQALDVPAAGKTGTTNERQVGLVRRLHRRSWPRPR